MKKCLILIAAIFLLCGAAFAAGDCETYFREKIDKLKSTDLVVDNQKKEYIPYLETAYKLF